MLQVKGGYSTLLSSTMLHVTLNGDATRFVAHGGDPKGGDKLNTVVSSWPGWARVAVAGRSECSTYAGPLSIPSALALSSTALDVTWGNGARERASTLLKSFERARAILEDKRIFARIDLPTSRKPFPHQEQAVQATEWLSGRVLLSDDMGLGKTSTALWTACRLSAERVLVLCPSSVKFNWLKEIEVTLGVKNVAVIDGTKKARLNQFAELRARYQRSRPLFVVINYDLLKHLSRDQLSMLSRFVADQLLIMDESHYLKNHASERSKIVRAAFCPSDGGALWRLALSGTPIRNTVEDLFSQIELIRPGTFYSFHWFLNRFTQRSIMRIPYRRGGKTLHKIIKKVRRAINEGELNQIVNTLQIRRLKSEVTYLPEKVLTYPELELDPHTAKIYAAMRDYALLLLEEHDKDTPVLSPTAKSAVEAAARCEQIAQGCVGGVPDALMPKLSGLLCESARAVDRKSGWLIFPKAAKILWLIEQLDAVAKPQLGQEEGGQSVTFCRFLAPLLWLEEKRLGTAVTGSMTAKKRQDVFDAFQAGEIRELYISVRIAEGFNLYKAQDEFFLGRDWAWAVNTQAVDRCHRIGQTGTVNVQMPFMRDTIEVRQHQALLQKEKDADNSLCFQTIADLKAALA